MSARDFITAAESQQAHTLAPISAREILATDYPAPRWAVPGLVPEGLTILAGHPKVGKSWIALSLGVAVAAGGSFLGKRPAIKGAVTYFALEDNARRIKDRLLRLGVTSSPGELEFEFSLPPIGGGGLEALDSWLEAREDVRLVVLDVFNRIRAPRPKGADPYLHDAGQVALLQALAMRRAVSIYMTHHDKKAGADDWLDRVSGTQGIAGGADAVVLLERQRGGATDGCGSPDATSRSKTSGSNSSAGSGT